jgi:L-amino acid N-acyltransferase YncA
MLVRKAQISDAQAIVAIILPIIRDATTYGVDAGMSEAEALDYWMGAEKETFVVEDGDQIVGTYYMRPNNGGSGNHVCNCGYMTSSNATGRGVASLMCDHSLDYARAQGYRAMQFNFVVSTNDRAIQLWMRKGFEVAGRLPGAFRHPTAGYVDALVMFQTL